MNKKVLIVGILLLGFTLLGAPQAFADETALETLPAVTGDPLVLAQADVSTSAQPVAEVTEEGEQEADSKWWSLTFSYELSHNLAKERPVVGNAFAVAPGFSLPYDISLGLHLGFSVSTQYPGEGSGSGDVVYNNVDMDPLSVSLSRRFAIDPDVTGFAITVGLNQLVPGLSESARTRDWHYAISPSVTLGVSKWGLSFSNRNAFQKNFHSYDYYKFANEAGSISLEPLNEWTYSNSSSLRYSVWKLDMGVGFTWSRAWRYNNGVTEQPSNTLIYTADIGIAAYDGLNIGTGISTAGPERRFGGFGSDYTVPLDPKFTQVFLSVSYTL